MKLFSPALLVAAASSAALPQFAAPFKVQAGGGDLTVQLIADPFMIDWNGDGLNDLIVGQFTNGNVRFYPNSGTNQNPAFSSYTLLQADGAPITTTYG